MSRAQSSVVRNAFDTAVHPEAHREVWARRSYAPMHIHSDEFQSLRSQIYDCLPDYAIAFDAVFESDGSSVGWHCDYESLGPFHVPNRLAAVRDHHFVTVHFNLTDRGGSLRTLPWVWSSYLFYAAIARYGLFSGVQTLLTWIFMPVFALCSKQHSNEPLRGNIFDNTRLHAVTTGAPRISYVVRLVKRGGCVHMSQKSVSDGIKRSDACTVFERVHRRLPDAGVVDASTFQWKADADND